MLPSHQQPEGKDAAQGNDFAPLIADVARYHSHQDDNKRRRSAGDDIAPLADYDLELELLTARRGVPWFNDRREDSPLCGGWADPNDYHSIRDNPDQLRSFIDRIVRIAPHWVGHSGHGDSSAILAPADYVVWLHQHSTHEPFKHAIEKVVSELTAEALIAPLTPLLLDEQRQIINTTASPKDLLSLCERPLSLDDLLRRSGLLYEKESKTKQLREQLTAALRMTERPITLDEVLRSFGGPEEHLREVFERGDFSEFTVVHPKETPESLQRDFREWAFEHEARRRAMAQYSPQLVPILGLLQIVGQIGSPQNALAKLDDLLALQIRSGFLRGIEYRHNGIELNPTQLLRGALARIQQPGALHDLWLELLRQESEPGEAIAAFAAGLLGCPTPWLREKFITEGLSALSEKLVGRDLSAMQCVAGFIREDNLGEQLAHLINKAVSGATLHYAIFDRDSCSVALTMPTATGFSINIFSPTGPRSGECQFDLLSDSISGPSDLTAAARRYIDETGAPLTNKLAITSYEARVINEHSKLFTHRPAADGPMVEGIVGLNTVHLYFLHDPRTMSTRFALPESLDGCFLFQKVTREHERLLGFEGVERVSHRALKDPPALADSIAQQARKARREGLLGAPIELLDGCLTEAAQVTLMALIRARIASSFAGVI